MNDEIIISPAFEISEDNELYEVFLMLNSVVLI